MSLSPYHISDYLSQHKTLSLERIGSIDLSGKTDEDIFKYDKHAETSPEFIKYLSEKLQKPASLVSLDLEYFLDQSRQLMNIRASSLNIPGIGHIYANNNGTYVFGSQSSESAHDSDKKTFEDVYAKSSFTPSVNYATVRKSRKTLWRSIAAIIIIGGLIAFGTYYIHSTPALLNGTKKDTLMAQQDTSKKDSADVQPEIARTKQPLNNGFKFIIQSFPDMQSCIKRQQQLKSYGDAVSSDSIVSAGKTSYRLFVTDSAATVSDTARIKDSLHTYFGHDVSVE